MPGPQRTTKPTTFARRSSPRTCSLAIAPKRTGSVASALLLGVVALVARTGPSPNRALRWVSFGSFLTVGGWVAMTVLFGLYLSEFANYDDVYGGLLTAFLIAEYLYAASVVFLAGFVVDRLVETKASRT